jgi:adenylate cyclase
VGDVVIEGEQLYGDGVNVAARLQALADAGGIVVSGTVYDQIENKLVLTYEYLGEQPVVYPQRADNSLARKKGSIPPFDRTERECDGMQPTFPRAHAPRAALAGGDRLLDLEAKPGTAASVPSAAQTTVHSP